MKVAIGTPDEVGPDFIWFSCEYARPHEIRSRLRELATRDPDARIATLNRTVLDSTRVLRGEEPILLFEDILVWQPDRKQLVPLTELLDPDWLAHISLGDLFEHGELDRLATSREPRAMSPTP